jgi:predicted metal-dependent phosphoesterase TrpH
VRVDLHTHSSCSDGTLSPSDLVRAAAAAGLHVVALTDHDTTSGWEEAASALPYGLSLVQGTELSCRHGDISLHLLAYAFDPTEPALVEAMRVLRDSRVGRAERMVEALVADGVPVTWEQVQGFAGGVVGRPHIAQSLMALGVVSSVEEAFGDDWIGTGGRFWRGREELDVLEAIRLVQTAGGVTVFAHPGAASRGRIVGDEVIVEMAAAGLRGLEVDHSDHPPEMRTHLRGMAAELGLVVTGASDFHGANKQVQLGENVTDPAALGPLLEGAHGTMLGTAATGAE